MIYFHFLKTKTLQLRKPALFASADIYNHFHLSLPITAHEQLNILQGHLCPCYLSCEKTKWYLCGATDKYLNKKCIMLLLMLNLHLHLCSSLANHVCSWYVQNVSTFLNPFAIVFPLICVFWIQLTRTNAVFSRIALVSRFCAEIQHSGKILENIAKLLFYQKTQGARRWDREEPRGAHTTWWRGPGQATPGGGVAASAITSSPSSTYLYPLTWKHRGFSIFPG
jgi:hypothetical protein